MTKKWRSLRSSVLARKIMAPGLLSIALAIVWVGCGGGPPFGANDPPPSFAIQYSLIVDSFAFEYPATFSGNCELTLGLPYQCVDILGQQFNPAGGHGYFSGLEITNGGYGIVNDGRWPTIWNFTQTAGNCMGQSLNGYYVEQKIIVISCAPRIYPLAVTPNPVYGADSSNVQVTLDPSQAYAQATVLVVRGSDGYVEANTPVNLDGNGSGYLTLGQVSDGTHYIGAATSSDVATGSFSSYGNSPPATGSISANPDPCSLGGASVCTSTIGWDTSNVSNAFVYVSLNGQPDVLFVNALYGNQNATWIAGGNVYVFTLYDCSYTTCNTYGHSGAPALASVTVLAQ